MKKPVVVLVEKIYHKARDIFDAVQDLEIVLSPAGETPLSTVIRERNAIAVIVGTEKYTGPLYQALGKSGLIARFGVGYDSIDLVKASRRQLLVTNTPGVLDSTVAEYTVFLAAEVLRKCGAASQLVRNKGWHTVMGNELHGKTWAIIGLGNIGKKLGRILHFGFGVNVSACTRSAPDKQTALREYGIGYVSSDFAGTVAAADIVSIHLPANTTTRQYLNGTRLGLLKPGAIVINTARGSLVDENALYDRLLDGHLYGAGLDVFEHEPYHPIDPAKDLRSLTKVVMTPHIASSTVECGKRMATSVLRNIRLALTEDYTGMDLVSPSAPRVQ